MMAATRSKVTLVQISPDGEDCLRCQKLVLPEVSYAEIDPTCTTNTYGKAEYEIAGIVTISGVICADCYDAEHRPSSSDLLTPGSGDGREADVLTTPVGLAFLSNLREPIAAALRDGVADVTAHLNAQGVLEDVVGAGTLGIMRLIATVGEQICRAIEASR